MSWLRDRYTQPPMVVLHLLFVLTAWMYAGMHVMASPALQILPPYVFAVVRTAIGLPVIYLISLMEKRVELTWKDSAHLMVTGLIGVGIGNSVVFYVNTLIGPGVLAMMIPLATIFTAVMSAILGMERIGPLKAFGVALAVFGSVSIAWVTETDFHSDTIWGVALMFLQGIAASAYFILMSSFLKKKPIPLYAFFRATLWGFLFILPIGAHQVPGVIWSEVPYWVWLAEVYCGIVISSGAHVIMSWLIKHCAAFLPALYTSLHPVATVVLAMIFLGERFNVWLILCMICILGGMFLVIIAQATEVPKAKRTCLDLKCEDENDEKGLLLPLKTPSSQCEDAKDENESLLPLTTLIS